MTASGPWVSSRHPALVSRALALMLRAVFADYRRRARGLGLRALLVKLVRRLERVLRPLLEQPDLGEPQSADHA